jgi:RimJ/RimL family protein N-acetyltransferase
VRASGQTGNLGRPDAAHRRVLTERLELRAMSMADLDEVYALMSDPRVWQHRPTGVHRNPDQTAGQLTREARGWELDGLAYWSARLRDGGVFAGVGGCRLHATAAWNLYYRIRPELQGNGYASELARAAIAAARAVDPTIPIVASVLEHNLASRAVATGAGLRLEWQGMETDGPSAGALRLLFCDREADAALLEALHARRG